MKQLKKRTLALVLASVVTVVGSFAADNYKNSIMGIDFPAAQGSNVSMVLQTKSNYSETINLIKRDANTYVITLSEFNSTASTPDLSKTNGCIESVNIRTMPYSENAKGYTRITIKTASNVNINAKSQIYIASNDSNKIADKSDSAKSYDNSFDEAVRQREEIQYRQNFEEKESSYKNQQESLNVNSVNKSTDNKKENIEEQNAKIDNSSTVNVSPAPVSTDNSGSDATTKYIAALAVLLIMAIIAYIYVKGKEKLTDVVGERLEIDTSEKEEEKKEPPKQQQKPIARQVPKPAASYQSKIDLTQIRHEESKPIEELNVVDLDELFQEQQNNDNDKATENSDLTSDLDDFLSEFSFDEPEQEEVIEEGPLYDEETYEKVINGSFKFSKDDIKCIKELLNSEINEDTLRNIDEYAVSNPIVSKKPSQNEILENLVTDYAISQNISFTNEDIGILRKLISVEIDPDFVTDLRTNPRHTAKVAKDIETHEARIKPSKIMTLNVKDMLPNLSEELAKGHKNFESEGVKPVTVYYSEGYEYTKLEVDDLPDLSVEINNKDSYISQPSAQEEIVASGYEYTKLSIGEALPNLADVLAHPEKYREKPKEKPVADENALLNSISNVQFKPFDDGTRNFEVINDFDEEPAPSVDDIQKEFSQFGDLEITEEKEEIVSANTEYDDFESIYDNNYVDLDEKINQETNTEQVTEIPKIVPEQPKIQPEPIVKPEPQVQQIVPKPIPQAEKREPSQKSEELLKKIQEARAERAAQRAVPVRPTVNQQINQTVAKPKQEKIKCICEGISYEILDTVSMGDNIGCHLAKNENGYTVFAYKGDNLVKLKEYSSIKVEKIQARMSERIANGSPRYIVRTSAGKFIVDIKDNQVCYVMDLC